MADREFAVLFLCTGNSARSIMAECAMNRWGKGKFKASSAGSHPAGEVHPMTLQLLNELNYETAGLRSKNWDEFARPDSPPLDFVFTVCDKVAGEMWPGVAVVPTMSTGATDGSYLNAAGVPTYGLSGMFHDAEGSHAHGLNERIRVKSLMNGRRFLYEVVKLYASEE